MFYIVSPPHLYLRSPRFHASDERQESVSRRAGNYLDSARVLKFSKSAKQIAAIAILEQITREGEMREVHLRSLVHHLVFARAAHFLFAKLDEFRYVTQVSLLKQIIGQHFAQRRSQSQCDARSDAVRSQTVEDVKQRDVSFAYGFEEPFFFEEFGIFRVTHKGQVRMKN